RQYEQNQRKQNLDRRLLRRFFSSDAASRPERVRTRLERRRDLRAKLLALDQRRGERLDILDRGPFRESAQRLSKRRAGRNIAGDQAQLNANLLSMLFAFGADDSNRLIEPKARFDAEHQQIKNVGELPRDSGLALARALSEDVAGHEDSQPNAPKREQQRLRGARVENQTNQQADRAAADREQYSSDLIGLWRTRFQVACLSQGLLKFLAGRGVQVGRRNTLGCPAEKHPQHGVVLQVALERSLRDSHFDCEIGESFVHDPASRRDRIEEGAAGRRR